MSTYRHRMGRYHVSLEQRSDHCTPRCVWRPRGGFLIHRDLAERPSDHSQKHREDAHNLGVYNLLLLPLRVFANRHLLSPTVVPGCQRRFGVAEWYLHPSAYGGYRSAVDYCKWHCCSSWLLHLGMHCFKHYRVSGTYETRCPARNAFAPIRPIGSLTFFLQGGGLMTLFTPTSSVAYWVGYQALYGAGIGFGLQQPLIAVQAVLPEAQISEGTVSVIRA